MTVHLVVTYADHQVGFYPVPEDGGWRVDAASRCLVIGHGVPRIHVPLDSVQCFVIEDCQPRPRPHTTHGCWCGVHHAQVDAL